jgi:hypothetical protein
MPDEFFRSSYGGDTATTRRLRCIANSVAAARVEIPSFW